jgi:hypothetical protein
MPPTTTSSNVTSQPRTGLMLAGVGSILFALFLFWILGTGELLTCSKVETGQVSCEVKQSLWQMPVFKASQTFQNVKTTWVEEDCREFTPGRYTCLNLIYLQTNQGTEYLQTQFGTYQHQQEISRQINHFLASPTEAPFVVNTLNWTVALITLICTFVPSFGLGLLFLSMGYYGKSFRNKTDT